MSLSSNIDNMITAMGTSFKALRTSVGTLSSLTTTNKSDLVSAINEVKAGSAGAPPDATTAVKGVVLLADSATTVTGTDTAKATTSAGTKAAIDARIDNSTLGTSTVNAPSAGAVKTYVDGILGANDAMVLKGGINASTNPNYPAANAGDTYRITTAGKIGGASGPNVEVGDLLICFVDATAAGTQAAVGANWIVEQTNIDGAVTGPASAVSGNLTSYSGTSGKVVQDSGFSISNAAMGVSPTVVPTQKAITDYAQPLDTELSALATLTTSADKVPYFTGVGTAGLATFTAAGRTLVGAADATAQRAALSVYSTTEIGSVTTDWAAAWATAIA